MGFNSMFSSLAGEGENSDKIFTKNGAKVKFMTNKQQATVFTILPALDPQNPDKRVSYYPSILPDGSLSDWGHGAYVYRGVGHGDWKERFDVVSLSSVGEECPMDILFRTAKSDPTWNYLVNDIGKWGDPDRVRAALPPKKQLLFCNVFLPNEQERVAHVGIFSKALATKIVGENGIVFAPSMASDEQIKENYLSAYANGDITDPQGAPAFVVEKGHDKGEMSAYEIKFALDGNRRVQRYPATQDILATRYNLTDVREYLNILSADQIVQLLIREFTSRSPAGYHEYALLKLAFGSRWQIPEPPSAPGAVNTVQAGFAPQPAAPVSTIVPTAAPATSATPTVAPAATATMAMPPPPPPASSEANAALASAVKAGAVPPPAPQVPMTPAAGQVPGDPVPKFDKNAFLARLAKTGGNQ